MRKNKGITLIALVITIIVLLILAGVALSGITGNEGILTKAEKAVNETNIAGAKEQAELMIEEYSTDYYDARFVRREPDAENQKVVDYVKTQFGSGKVTSNGEFYITMKDNAVIVYEGNDASTVAQKNKIAVGLLDEAGKIEWVEVVELPEGLEVGDTVTYSPSGTYNWQAKYASSDLADDGTADVALATGSSVADGAQDMSITTWKVLSIDQTTGKVQLVPSAPTTGEVRLQGAQGYNNAVYLLNDACSKLYGNSSKGISARSINIEDIEGAMTDEALETVHSYNNNGDATWGTQTASPYTVDKQYPTIYAKENLSVINGVKNTAGLGMSDQTALIGRTDEGATNGKITSATSIQPYQTYWTCDNVFMRTAFKGKGYNLLIPSSMATGYWVASRCVIAFSGDCDFSVRSVDGGFVGADWMRGSYGFSYYDAHALFPIVSLNVNLISGNDTDGWSVN